MISPALAINDDFAQQLANEGWSQQDLWKTKSNAGGTWHKTDEKGQKLLGELYILPLSGNNMELTLAARVHK